MKLKLSPLVLLLTSVTSLLIHAQAWAQASAWGVDPSQIPQKPMLDEARGDFSFGFEVDYQFSERIDNFKFTGEKFIRTSHDVKVTTRIGPLVSPYGRVNGKEFEEVIHESLNPGDKKPLDMILTWNGGVNNLIAEIFAPAYQSIRNANLLSVKAEMQLKTDTVEYNYNLKGLNTMLYQEDAIMQAKTIELMQAWVKDPANVQYLPKNLRFTVMPQKIKQSRDDYSGDRLFLNADGTMTLKNDPYTTKVGGVASFPNQ